jgi:hypothetical protein
MWNIIAHIIKNFSSRLTTFEIAKMPYIGIHGHEVKEFESSYGEYLAILRARCVNLKSMEIGSLLKVLYEQQNKHPFSKWGGSGTASTDTYPPNIIASDIIKWVTIPSSNVVPPPMPPMPPIPSASLSYTYTGTSEQKTIVKYWLENNEITDQAGNNSIESYTRHRSDKFGGKAGTLGFIFIHQSKFPPLVDSFLLHLLATVSNNGYRISGMQIHNLSWESSKHGFFFEVNAKRWNAMKCRLDPDEAIKILMCAYKGIPLDFSEFASARKRRDGKYAWGIFASAWQA